MFRPATLRFAQHVIKRNIHQSNVRFNENFNALNQESGSYSNNFGSDVKPRRPLPGVNRIELLGGVVAEPRINTTRNGKDFIYFNVATNTEFKKADGTYGTHDDFHHVIAYGALVKFIQNNVQKGTRVIVNGRMTYTGGQLNENGERSQKSASVIADIVQPLAKPVKSFQSE